MLLWSVKKFDELKSRQLYDILKLRSEVFILEQNNLVLDCDGYDLDSYHLTGMENDKLVAYARIIPPGLIFEDASIGRVVVGKNHRKSGYGKHLINKALSVSYGLGYTNITIYAQYRLIDFYKSFLFAENGEVYSINDIEYIPMRLEIKQKQEIQDLSLEL